MNTLLSPWTIFKFNNNNMADNMLIDEPSSNGVEAFVIIDSITTSFIPWSTRISKTYQIWQRLQQPFVEHEFLGSIL